MEENSLLIQEYAKNPLSNFAMKDFTVKQHEGNFICWDDIVVYLRINWDIVEDYSFDWNCSSITTASASLLSEFVVWKNICEILDRGYQKIKSFWLEVSERRKRAAVIALLAVRNAIHVYLKDGKEDVFDDLFDD